MENIIIFKDNNIELKIGDFLVLKTPKNDIGFQTSEIGKLFKKEYCDTAKLEVKQKRWLEIYFELTLYKHNKKVLIFEDIDDIFYENVDYNFARYLIKKGAVKI